MVFEEGVCVGNRAGHELQLLVGGVTAVSVSRNKMALDGPQHMTKVLGVRAVDCLGVAQLQRFPCFLHEIKKLVDFEGALRTDP